MKAHKAMMITDVGFTSGAFDIATECNIALHVLNPIFDSSILPSGDRNEIQKTVTTLVAEGNFFHELVRKSMDFSRFRQWYAGGGGFIKVSEKAVIVAINISMDEFRIHPFIYFCYAVIVSFLILLYVSLRYDKVS